MDIGELAEVAGIAVLGEVMDSDMVELDTAGVDNHFGSLVLAKVDILLEGLTSVDRVPAMPSADLCP